MTENEAIKRCDMLINGMSINNATNRAFEEDGKDYPTFATMKVFAQTCRKALEEIQQYRAFGTVEGFKRAIESSIENYNLYREYKAKVQEFETIGTIEEFKALKNKHIGKDNMVISSSDLMKILNSDSKELKEVRKGFEENRKAGYKHGYADGYAKGIDDLVNGLLNWKSQDEEYKSFSDVCNEIAESLKGEKEHI